MTVFSRNWISPNPLLGIGCQPGVNLGGILNFDIFDIYNFKTGDFSTMTNVHDKKMNSDLCLVFVYGPAQEE